MCGHMHGLCSTTNYEIKSVLVTKHNFAFSLVFEYEVHLYVLSLYVKDEWRRHIVGKLWEKMAV